MKELTACGCSPSRAIGKPVGSDGCGLTFATVPGQMSQLECKTNLTDPVWTPLGSPIPGTGSSASVGITNHTGSFQGF